MFRRQRHQNTAVAETFSRAFNRLVALVTKADFDSHARAVRRYADIAKGDDVTVGEGTVPAVTLLPDGHEGMEEVEIEFGFQVTGMETDRRQKEVRGVVKAEVKDDLLGTGADVGLTGQLLLGKDYVSRKNAVGVIHCKVRFSRQPIPDGLRLLKEHVLNMERAALKKAQQEHALDTPRTALKRARQDMASVVGITTDTERRKREHQQDYRYRGLYNWQVLSKHSTKSAAQNEENRLARLYGYHAHPGGAGSEYATWYVYQFDY